jgi:hypothetical protein
MIRRDRGAAKGDGDAARFVFAGELGPLGAELSGSGAAAPVDAGSLSSVGWSAGKAVSSASGTVVRVAGTIAASRLPRKASTLSNRLEGSFSSACINTDSSRCGNPGSNELGGGGAACSCMRIRAAVDRAWNGTRPTVIS